MRTYTSRDAPRVSALHRLALPRGFLSSLGDRFLGTLYGLLATAPGTRVLVAADDGDRCVGFVAGSIDVRHAYRHVLRRGWFPLLGAMLPATLRPGVLPRAVQTLIYPLRRPGRQRKPARPEGEVETIRAELLSIAVAAEARGHGLGRKLVAALEDDLRQWGHDGPYRVVTDSEDPRSNAFYLALGFARAGEFLHHGHVMAIYTRTLPREAPVEVEE
ncbi:MAG: GNAT family N-acetyltransferase [Candidatus Krumholzibacteriia bacterium]